MDYGFLSILPSVLSIVLAIAFKNVFLALISACFLANFIITDWSIFTGMQNTLLSFVKVFESKSNTMVIFAIILLGGLIYLMEVSGGIQGFVNYLTKKNQVIKSKKAASFFTWLIGILVFTTGTLSVLVAGSVSRPINDALKVPPEKSAFIIHSTSTPWSVLVPISLWGPFMIGLLEASGVNNATGNFFRSIPLNFYCLLAVFGTLLIILSGKDFGPMKKIEEKYNKLVSEEAKSSAEKSNEGKAMYLILPIVLMIVIILTVMLVTGGGNFIKGDGYSAVLWGILIATVVSGVIYVKDKVFTFDKFLNEFFKGCGSTLFIATLLIFAFALGSSVKELNTGKYLADIFVKVLSPSLLPLMVFLACCIMSFSTGTSVGTFSVMAPIAFSMALSMDANIALVAAAVWGGGIFGDHASPISDSTIISSSVSGCTVPNHIKTQLPYSLSFAGITAGLYFVLGFILL